MAKEPAKLSVVVPFHCEEAGVESFFAELCSVLHSLKHSYEIIAVDDGSTDQTLTKLRAIQKKEPHIHIISLSRNYGHQIALLAGLDHAEGDAVITMDGDLQHPPKWIPQMIEQWQGGYDVVNMTKEKTENRGGIKNFCAHIFYWVFNQVSEIQLEPNQSDFRLLDARVLREIRKYRQKQFFLRGIVAELGFRQTQISFQAPARIHGTPSYSLRKLLELALRGFFSYSNFGLKIPMFLGTIMLALAVGNLGYSLFKIYTGQSNPQGWFSLFSLITFSFSLTFLFLGIHGYYLSRIFDEIKQKPLYTIQSQAKD